MDRLNQWLTLFANVGVIIGIGFLAYEIRQNTQALQAASMDSTIQAANDIRANLFLDPEITEIYRQGLQNIEDLNEVDRERFRLIMTNALWAFWNTYIQSRLGGRQSWESQRGIARRFLSQPGGVWFWEHYGSEFEPDFQAEIDSILKEAE